MAARTVVGGAFVAALGATLLFVACRAAQPAGPPVANSASPSPQPEPALPAPTATLSGSAEPDGVSQALAMRQCESPMAAITNMPDGGVIFNNAMTSVDAGFIDRAQPVLDAVAARSLELRCCFERWLGSHPDDQPRAMLQLTLAADGGVQAARIDPQRSTITDPPTLACITGLARDIAFPPSPSGKATIVEYPIAVGAGAAN